MTLLPIILSAGFNPKVSVKDKVSIGDVLAEKESSFGENNINISSALGINSSKISKFLVKSLGDQVKEGDVVALKKSALGIGGKKVLSEFSGTVVKIDEEKGDLVLKSLGAGDLETIISPVEGSVDFCNNEKIVIKTDKNVLVADDSLGGENTGGLLFLEALNDLDKDVENKILVCKSIDRVNLFKAIGLDAVGIITQELEDFDFVDFEEKPLSASIALVSKENFEKLLKHKESKVYINGKNKNIIIL